MAAETDRILRAVTDTGSFRTLVARTTDTVNGILRAQGAAGDLAVALADLATGAVLFRELMAPSLRAQAVIEGAGDSGRMVADSFPDGATRGLALGGPSGALDLGAGALLRMSREMPRGGLHEGVVAMVPGGGLTTALTRYLMESEQVVAVIAVATVLGAEGDVSAAGGYVMQLLPEADRAQLAIMTERLADLPPLSDFLREGRTPEDILGELTGGFGATVIDTSPVEYRCPCSQDRVERSLVTLDPAELKEHLASGEPLTLHCEFCRRGWTVSPGRILELLAERGTVQ